MCTACTLTTFESRKIVHESHEITCEAAQTKCDVEMVNVLGVVEDDPGSKQRQAHQLHRPSSAEVRREAAGENAAERHADQVDR